MHSNKRVRVDPEPSTSSHAARDWPTIQWGLAVSMLDAQDTARVARVCRRWHRLVVARQETTTTLTLDLKRTSTLLADSIANPTIGRWCRQLTSLVLVERNTTRTDLDQRGLFGLRRITSASNLRHLDVSWLTCLWNERTTDWYHDALWTAVPLKTLVLGMTRWTLSSWAWMRLQLPSLTTLECSLLTNARHYHPQENQHVSRLATRLETLSVWLMDVDEEADAWTKAIRELDDLRCN